MDFFLTNNDPSAIYDSGQLNLDAMLGNVADSIIANNSAYSGFTRNDVMSEWGASIRAPPTGEVYTGWSRSLDGNGVLQLTHMAGRENDDYTVWNSTSDNPSQDLMAITLSVPKSQLDFNDNGIFDAATESLYKTTENVADAFVGTSESGLTNWSADGNSYNVVPEPATQGLITLGCLAALAYRRFFGKR